MLWGDTQPGEGSVQYRVAELFDVAFKLFQRDVAEFKKHITGGYLMKLYDAGQSSKRALQLISNKEWVAAEALAKLKHFAIDLGEYKVAKQVGVLDAMTREERTQLLTNAMWWDKPFPEQEFANTTGIIRAKINVQNSDFKHALTQSALEEILSFSPSGRGIHEHVRWFRQAAAIDWPCTISP